MKTLTKNIAVVLLALTTVFAVAAPSYAGDPSAHRTVNGGNRA